MSTQKITWPDKVTICEVGLRDGLQNEKTIPSVEQKLQLLNAVVASGLKVFRSKPVLLSRHEIHFSGMRRVAAIQAPMINHALVIDKQPAAVVGVQAKRVLARFQRRQGARPAARRAL